MKYYINPYTYFLLQDGQFIIWNYKNHRQFALTPEYIERLRLWSENPSEAAFSPLDEEMEKAGLLSKVPYEKEEWGWDVLSQIFHVGTQDTLDLQKRQNPKEWVESYMAYCQEIAEQPVDLFIEKEGTLFDLPSPQMNLFQDISFQQVLKKRMTSRSFSGEALSLEIFSTLLFASFGLIHGVWDELKAKGLESIGMRKASPAAGALHSTEAYVVALRVEGLPAGAYYYRPQDHKLTLLEEGFFDHLLVDILSDHFFVKDLSAGVFLCGHFAKLWWKYKHSRSYREALFDAGHASQTFLLSATALGLNTWMTGALRDSEAHKLLRLKGIKEAPLLFVGVGYGERTAIPAGMEAVAQSQKFHFN